MRTVDPELWSKKAIKPILHLSKPYRFGFRQSDLEVRLRYSLYDAMKEFCKNSSVVGIKLVTNVKMHNLMRCCYLIFFTMTVISGAWVLLANWKTYGNVPPLIVNHLMSEGVMSGIKYPAVAICSSNIISRAALEDYAQYIFALDKNNTFTFFNIKTNLLAFGALLTMASVPFDLNFMNYLANVAKETNVTRIMYKLSPKCNSLLIRCQLQGRRRHCTQWFAPRLTPLGFCCVFNSRYTPVDRNNEAHKYYRTGISSRISVIVRENADDFAYGRRSGGDLQPYSYKFMKVLLFDGEQYPLLVGGVATSFIAQRDSTVLMKLKTHVQSTSSSLKYYSESTRGCRKMSRDRGFDVKSWSICLTRCQRNAAIALCKCAPYFLPAFDSKVAAECSLEHLECLAKYREKFMYFYPGVYLDAALDEERMNSLECIGGDFCLPDCNRRQHTAKISLLRHAIGIRVFKNRLQSGLDLTNSTVIRMFYTSDNQQSIVIDTYVPWYHITAFVGGQLTILVSTHLICVAELLYFCTIRWAHHYRRRKRLLQLAAEE